MALLENCFCCSLAIAAGFFAVYLLIAYLIAFAFELLWILESTRALPATAVLLCAEYFTLVLFAALLIHGLATKNTLCLICWMFSVTVLTFPEAGMVIFMSIQYWRIETLYGMTELICWLTRIITNVVELVIIQSLYTIWRDEELVDKRLRDLNMSAVSIPRDTLSTLNSQFYQNNGYANSMEHLNFGLKRTVSTPQIWNGTVPNNISTFPFDNYQFFATQSEFNASIFMPSLVGSDNEVPLQSKKAQSLMDLRFCDDNVTVDEMFPHQFPPLMAAQSVTKTSSAIIPNYALSLDRRIHHHPRLPSYGSVDALNDINKGNHVIKHRTGFYAQPIANYGVPIYYGPLDGPDFLIYKKQIDKLSSKNSLSNNSADDVQKYRDVAL